MEYETMVFEKGKWFYDITINRLGSLKTLNAKVWNELDRIQAYMSGKLKMYGDVTLLMQLEDMITELCRSSYEG